MGNDQQLTDSEKGSRSPSKINHRQKASEVIQARAQEHEMDPERDEHDHHSKSDDLCHSPGKAPAAGGTDVLNGIPFLFAA